MANQIPPMSDIDRGIICGFFEGEGCISAWGDHQQVWVSFAQKYSEVLVFIQGKLGGMGCLIQSKNGSWQLRIVGKRNIKQLIKLMYPIPSVRNPS